MIKVSAIALAAMLPPALLAVGAEPSALVSSYYQMRLHDEPTGVYEWDEQDLLFVQVRVPEAYGDDAEDMGGRILLAEHDELFAWLAKQATLTRQDPTFSPGMENLRRLVRAEYPLWEYVAEWKYDFNGPHFSRHEVGERVCCAVCRKSEILATMPPSFKKPSGPETWKKGARQLVREKYSDGQDRPFLWGIGLLDVLAFSLGKDETLASWARDFGSEDAVTLQEYTNAEAKIREYMQESDTAKWYASEKLRLETLPDLITYEWDSKPAVCETAEKSSIVTNGIDEATFEVVTTIVETRRQTRILKKITTHMAVDPVFEKLFLSGGTMPNSPLARTSRGRAAEKAFYASSAKTPAEREQILVEALRENPGDKVLWNLLGRIMFNRKDGIGALACFRNALRLDRNYDYALANLAIAYDSLGFHNLAYGAATVAFGLSKNDWCVRESMKIIEAK